MVTITKSILNNGYEYTFDGHADFNRGEDIVCSAISILFYTFASSLMNCKGCDVEVKIEESNK